jgi:[ribosomal protein S5]-alanine N-acetyltransferase
MTAATKLHTARLILRPLQLADAGRIQLLFPHWEIVRYMAGIIPWPYPADGALSWIRDIALPAIARGEEWQWTLRLKADPENLVGAIGLKKHETDKRGFWIGREWQRRRLMTEAADTVTDYWFDILKFPVLRVPKATANTDSRGISERQGMRVVATEDRDYVSGRLPAEIWEITAAEWNARRQLRS